LETNIYDDEYFKAQYEYILNNPYIVSRCLYHTPNFEEELEVIQPKKEETIVDVGCGLGQLPWLLSNSGVFTIGVDISRYAVTFAKKYYKNQHNEFLQMSATFLGFRPNSMDAILLFHLLEHLTDEQLRDLLRNVCNILKVGGRLVCVCPVNEKGLVSRLKKIFWMIKGFSTIPDPTHIQFFSVKQIIETLSKAGLQVQFYTPISSNKIYMKIIHMLLKFFTIAETSLIGCIIIKAVKKEINVTDKINFCNYSMLQ